MNSAMIAQGDFEQCYQLWETVDPYKLFDISEIEYEKITSGKLDKASIKQMVVKFKKLIKDNGIDISKMRTVLESVLDEKKLRQSPIDFGLVTISITDRKAMEIYREEIPEGQMSDYLLASANLPGFNSKGIEKTLLDGGFYDNCPINRLAEKGCRDIIDEFWD